MSLVILLEHRDLKFQKFQNNMFQLQLQLQLQLNTFVTSTFSLKRCMYVIIGLVIYLSLLGGCHKETDSCSLCGWTFQLAVPLMADYHSFSFGIGIISQIKTRSHTLKHENHTVPLFYVTFLIFFPLRSSAFYIILFSPL